MNKENQKKLPKTWEEWVEDNLIVNEFFINNLCEILRTGIRRRFSFHDANLLSSHEDAKGLLALIKLKRLRDTYNNGEIDYNDYSFKYSICVTDGKIKKILTTYKMFFLSFKTRELRDEFLKNFEELIIEAKMWL